MTTTRLAGALPRALATFVVLLVLAAFLATAPAGTAHADEDAEVTVALVQVTPTVVGPDDTQHVTIRVTNTGTTERTGLRAALGVGWRELATRSSVASWVGADDTRTAAGQLDLPVDDLPPGESTELTFELSVASLQLGLDAAWGPRQMSVALTDDAGTLAVLHSFLLYDPDGGTAAAGRTAPAPIALAVAAPLTGPVLDPADPDLFDDTVADRTATGGEYDRLLAAAAGTGSLSLAVDPAVVVSAATTTDEAANAWASDLQRDGAADVVTLPPYDVDMAALGHAEARPSDVAAVTDLALVDADWAPPAAWSTRVAWPAGTTDLPTLAAAAAADVHQVVTTDGVAGGRSALPTTTGTVATSGGDVSVLVADDALGDAVAATRSAGSTAATVQQILADTAVLAADAAVAGRQVDALAALPRGWSPDVDAFETVMTAVAASGWVEITPLTELIAAGEPEQVVADALVEDDAELGPQAVRQILTALDDVAAFATVAPDPATLAAEVDRSLVAPLSVAYRAAPDARDAALRLVQEQADQVRAGISVVDRADVTLISDGGNLPVRIRNDLPTDATVTVRLTPDDPRLVVETSPIVIVPAGESRDAAVRVRAIGSGDVTLDVDVVAPSGVPVADPAEFTVKVRAGWETVGTAVLAGGVGLLFVAGIWRTVRRGRSERRTTGEQVTEAAVPTGPQHAVPPSDDPEAPAP